MIHITKLLNKKIFSLILLFFSLKTGFAQSPVITLTSSFGTFSTCYKTASPSQTFTITGIDLVGTGNVTVISPNGFVMSTTIAGTYTGTLTIPFTSSTISPTAIFIRLSGDNVYSSGDITADATGGGNASINSVTGTVSSLGFIEISDHVGDSILSVCYGTNKGSFFLSGGAPGSMKWQSSPDNSIYTDITDSTRDVFTFNNVSKQTYYRAAFGVGEACVGSPSNNVLKIVPTSALKSGTISGSTEYCAGPNTTVLKLINNISGTSRKWQSSTDSVNYTDISFTAVADTLLVTNLFETTKYRVKIDSADCTAFSDTAQIKINPLSFGNEIYIGDHYDTTTQNICYGTTNSFILKTELGGQNINWQSSINGTDFTTIPGAITSTIDVNDVTVLGHILTGTNYFRAIFSNGLCNSVASFNTFRIIVNPAVSAGKIIRSDLTSGKDTLCANNNKVVLTLSGYTSGTIQWQYSEDNDSYYTIADSISSSFVVNNISSSRYYRSLVTSGDCSSISDTVKINVYAPSVAGIIIGSDSVCAGMNSTVLRLSGSFGAIQWVSSIDSVSGFKIITGANKDSLIVQNLTSTTYYKAVVSNSICDTVLSTFASIFVRPVVYGGKITVSDSVVCSGTNASNLKLTNNSVGSIQWQLSVDNTSFSNITDALIDSLKIRNLTSTTYYKALVNNGFCTANSDTIKIKVFEPSVAGSIIGSDTICTGTNTTILKITNKIGSIQWQTSTNDSVFTNINNAILDSLVVSNLTSTHFYRALVTNGVCSVVNTNVEVVKVIPLSIGGNIAGSTTVLSGTNNTTLVVTNYLGTLQWQSSLNDTSFTNITGANADTLVVSNLTSNHYYRVIVTNDVCSAAISTIGIILIQSNIPTDIMKFVKASDLPTMNLDGSFNVRFTLKVKNITIFDIDSLIVSDDLTKVFSDVSGIKVISTSVSGKLVKNSSYDGINDINLTTNKSLLDANNIDSIIFNINVKSNISGKFLNTANLSGHSKTGAIKLASTDSLKLSASPTTERIATPVEIPKIEIGIEPSFSPNNDGFNDTWIILHPFGMKLNVHIYNRWGNEVYSNPDYQNDWRGKGKGNILGEDVTEGTYYYVVEATDISGNIRKFAGSLTIVR